VDGTVLQKQQTFNFLPRMLRYLSTKNEEGFFITSQNCLPQKKLVQMLIQYTNNTTQQKEIRTQRK
jgi:hypothetical protein